MSAELSSFERDWLGELPPAPRNVGGRPAKHHRGRMRKLACGDCGAILYSTSISSLQRSGLPSCGCGGTFAVANLRDRALIEWETLARELESQGPRAWNAAMRELGADDLVIPIGTDGLVKRPRGSGLAPSRCQWEGGNCVKFTTGRYCPEHDPHAIAARDRESRRAA
jgi:NAD-dependent SIR2 family protein deacetylase